MDNDKVIEHIKYVYESGQVRLERTIKRLWILCIILAIGIICTTGITAGFIYYESQWQVEEKTEVTQDIDTGDGDTNITGVGDIYGTDKTEGN